jgi:hypothetical protein
MGTGNMARITQLNLSIKSSTLNCADTRSGARETRGRRTRRIRKRIGKDGTGYSETTREILVKNNIVGERVFPM